MPFVTLAFFLATLVIGVAQIVEGQTWPGVSFLVAGLFAFWGGAALKAAFFAPAARPRLVGLLIAAFFTVLGLLATQATGVRFEAFDRDLNGAAWVVAGLLAGIMGTRRRRYLVAPPVEKP
jgi:hypothetical protein